MNPRKRKWIDKILAWADAYEESCGEWPSAPACPAPAPGSLPEAWRMVHPALLNGRGLPDGLPLAELFAEHRIVPGRPHRPPLSEEEILSWADRDLDELDE